MSKSNGLLALCAAGYARGPFGRQTAGLAAWLLPLIAIAFLWFAAQALALTANLQSLEIASKSGVHVFSVELAVGDEQRARGLMFRKEVPEGYGMLFDFDRDQEVAMWMENTYVSLDMLFIRGDGRIARIAENTEPLSRRTISSGGPVRAVLEVVGGTARKLGIQAGDQVGFPLFKRR